MRDKGGVYLCHWKQNADGDYVGWADKRPKIRVETMTISEMEDYLADEVRHAFNDVEGIVEFDPPLPGSVDTASLFKDGLLTLSPGSHFRFMEADKLFDGICNRCKSPIGKRSKSEIFVKSIWPGDTSFSWDSRISGHLDIVSDRFLALLTTAELSRFNLRPVIFAKARRKKFFELLPKKFVQPCGVKGWKPSGWYCDLCKCQIFNYWEQLGSNISRVVRRSDLGRSIPSMFAVGIPGKYNLCVNRQRWKELRKNRATFGMSSTPLAVITDAQAEARPPLPEYNTRLQQSQNPTK
jgi:hypothetical protein